MDPSKFLRKNGHLYRPILNRENIKALHIYANVDTMGSFNFYFTVDGTSSTKHNIIRIDINTGKLTVNEIKIQQHKPLFIKWLKKYGKFIANKFPGQFHNVCPRNSIFYPYIGKLCFEIKNMVHWYIYI